MISIKSKILSVLLLFLLSITITACSNHDNKNSNNSISANSSPAPTNASSDSKIESAKTQGSAGNNMNSAREAYETVLQNKAEFFSTDDKKSVYLNDFLTNEEVYGAKFKVTHFTVIDMDGDKIPEVVLELTENNDVQLYEVLHYVDGEVYGYIQVSRGLEDLKADGTFCWANSAFNDGYGRLRFEQNASETEILGYCDVNKLNKYFINNKPVTEELYNSFIQEEKGKKDAVWSEFTQNNIETYLNVGNNVDTSPSQFEKGYYDYKGAINNNLSIQMSVYPLGQDMVGSYFYEKERKEINLEGKAGGKEIVLYEYDSQGENTGIFQGTMNTADKIQGTWTSPDGKKIYPFTLDLVSYLPGVEYGNRYGLPEGDQAVENYVTQIQSYLINDNKEKLAEQIAYPINAKIDGKVTRIQTKDALISHYDQIFNSNFKQVIRDAFTKYLFVNYQGIMFGNGMYNLWISEAMPAGGTAKLMITAMNN